MARKPTETWKPYGAFSADGKMMWLPVTAAIRAMIECGAVRTRTVKDNGRTVAQYQLPTNNPQPAVPAF